MIMFSLRARAAFARAGPLSRRALSADAQAGANIPDVRAQLMEAFKTAMKSKDSAKTTVIRTVLSEVYAADKALPSHTAPSSAIVAIIRKSANRRTEAAAEFAKAAREDLAEKEREEAAYLHTFLPPLLPAADIDRALATVLATPAIADAAKAGPAQKVLGQVFKAFYAQVDKSTVDPDLVRQRALALLAQSA
ncbi:Yqey-like protein-domain-containing protein [Lenzites betulinus]|nr:Yqey-like protein-domain-containing protein [Lenzites betulinus]